MKKEFEYKELDIDDLREAITMVKRVFLKFEAPEYEQKGIDTFLSFIEMDVMEKLYKEKHLEFWGCFSKDRIVGVIAMKKISHICMLFVDEEFHRRGIARELFNIATEKPRDNPAFDRITVHSSPFAVGFYHKIGFKDTEPEKTEDGIRHTPMEYVF